jgi:hypothetical protein
MTDPRTVWILEEYDDHDGTHEVAQVFASKDDVLAEMERRAPTGTTVERNHGDLLERLYPSCIQFLRAERWLVC